MKRKEKTKMRTPKIKAPETFEFNENLKKGENIICETREYELITPLFGGGAETKKADEISVIRATEIRGHLRFWWRATRGGQFANIQELREHEDSIFGSTEKYSALQIDLTIINRGKTFPDQQDDNGDDQSIDSIKSPLGYVAFPLRGENAEVIEKVEFSVKFTYPSGFSDDIKASLWAWEMFGGLGARTRRGFGAIQNKNYLPQNRNAVETDIQNNLTTYLSGNTWANDVPHLETFANTRYKVTNPSNSEIEVWNYLVKQLQKFRQARTGKYGRSKWSEPDAIRSRTSTSTAHRIPITNIDKFPRAAFGLPIVFKFKTDTITTFNDPITTTLEGFDEKQKRLSSPLIFRPIKCANNQAVGIALILSGVNLPSNGIVLRNERKNLVTDLSGNHFVESELSTTPINEASQPRIYEILNGNPNVLEAFLSTL